VLKKQPIPKIIPDKKTITNEKKWVQYGFTYKTTAGVNAVILKISTNAGKSNACWQTLINVVQARILFKQLSAICCCSQCLCLCTFSGNYVGVGRNITKIKHAYGNSPYKRIDEIRIYNVALTAAQVATVDADLGK